MAKTIKHTFYFNQSPQVVWDYLTKPELMEQWLMPNDFKPEVGHHFKFTNPNNTFVVCEVLEVKPFTDLAYVWKNDWTKTKTPYTSKVTWKLTPVETGTELELEHSGFELLKDLVAHSGGWAFLGTKLKDILNGPKK